MQENQPLIPDSSASSTVSAPAQSTVSAPAPLVTPVPARSAASLWHALSWVRDLAFSVLIAVILIVFIYQPVKVEGTSMMPTLTDKERIFINKFTYHFGLGEVERGDMVVFWFPLDRQKSYIKRVIGIPGDVIRIDAGQVYVNNALLSEDYAALKAVVDRAAAQPRFNQLLLGELTSPLRIAALVDQLRGSTKTDWSALSALLTALGPRVVPLLYWAIVP
jgi:signal peptidase I